jgi:glutamine synthetase
VIAAGLDGVERSLACPPPGAPPPSTPTVHRLPTTLAEALDVLEQDTVMTKALGRLADDYIAAKRTMDLAYFHKTLPEGATIAQQIAAERDYYMALI